MRFLTTSAIIMLFASCSKKNDDDNVAPTPTPVTKVDTLTSGWSKISVIQNGGFSDVFFKDNLNGFLTGSGGIFRSGDGGLSWTNVLPLSPAPFNIGYSGTNAALVGSGNSINSTQNNGSTFQTITGSEIVYDVFYSSPAVCHVITGGQVKKSIDGGLTFPSSFTFPTAVIYYSTLFFLNAQTGWAGRGDGKVWKTTDGGTNWSQASTVGPVPNGMEFVSADTGYLTSTLSLYKTTNGGTSFQPLHFFTGESGFTDVDFVTPAIGYVSCPDKIYKTTDGGASWSTVVSLATTRITEIHFTDAGHGWAACFDGSILRYN